MRYFLAFVWSQTPLFEHSASACAVIKALALSTQATPVGHFRFEQSGATAQLASQVHWLEQQSQDLVVAHARSFIPPLLTWRLYVL